MKKIVVFALANMFVLVSFAQLNDINARNISASTLQTTTNHKNNSYMVFVNSSNGLLYANDSLPEWIIDRRIIPNLRLTEEESVPNLKTHGAFGNTFRTANILNDSIYFINNAIVCHQPFVGIKDSNYLCGLVDVPGGGSLKDFWAGWIKDALFDRKTINVDQNAVNVYSIAPLVTDTSFSGIHAMRGLRRILSYDAYETDLHLNTSYGIDLSFKIFKSNAVQSERSLQIDSTGIRIRIKNAGGPWEEALLIDSVKRIYFPHIRVGTSDTIATINGNGLLEYKVTAPSKVMTINESDSTVVINGVTTSFKNFRLDDNDYYVPKTGVSGRGWLTVDSLGTHMKFADFMFDKTGAVTLLQCSANIADGSVDGNICIFQSGTGFRIENKIGYKRAFVLRIEYK